MSTHRVDPRRARLTPLEWIWTSPALREHVLSRQPHLGRILVADFGPGENDEVPTFFGKTFYELARMAATVYCIDSHELRLESLMNRLQEEGLIESSRLVLAKFETMSSRAALIRPQADQLVKSDENQNDVDRNLLADCRVPDGAFGLGILNNDLLGYLKEYYGMQGSLGRCLQEIRAVMSLDSMLIVTQPGMLYPMDNVALLETHGFTFVEAIDVDLADNNAEVTADRHDAPTRTRMNHYCAIVFAKTTASSDAKA